MSTQPSSNPTPRHGADPAAVERQRLDFFLSMLNGPETIEYVSACVRRVVSVYDALASLQEGVPIEYVTAVNGI